MEEGKETWDGVGLIALAWVLLGGVVVPKCLPPEAVGTEALGSRSSEI